LPEMCPILAGRFGHGAYKPQMPALAGRAGDVAVHDDPDHRLNKGCAFSSIGYDGRAPRFLQPHTLPGARFPQLIADDASCGSGPRPTPEHVPELISASISCILRSGSCQGLVEPCLHIRKRVYTDKQCTRKAWKGTM
jgi:hypothetical protein